jgi:parvulin-like peptidyl-prolyl isomerase
MKLRAKVLSRVHRPTAKQILAYYRAHRREFSVPQRRDVLEVVTKTRAEAATARRELEQGRGFADVARRRSIDLTTNRRGGKLTGVRRGVRGPGFDQAVFSTPEGRLVGPVSTPLGFGVFRVTGIHRPHRSTLTQARTIIRRRLTAQRRREALAAFAHEFTNRWRAQTECAQTLRIPDCRNGPRNG